VRRGWHEQGVDIVGQAAGCEAPVTGEVLALELGGESSTAASRASVGFYDAAMTSKRGTKAVYGGCGASTK
jgi:hypothetical protein